MNIFILCTGRNGSLTFSRACSHISNYTSAHESRVRFLGDERFAYPKNHIEVDNRLSWMLGRLYQTYGDDACYVHMTRDDTQVAESHKARYHTTGSIAHAYHRSVLMGATTDSTLIDVCLDYCRTVNANIELFIRDRPHKMQFPLEQATEVFPAFWELIAAEGDFDAAMAEWKTRSNQTVSTTSKRQTMSAFRRAFRHSRRILNLVFQGF